MSAKIEGLFSDYAGHHQTAGNVRCHLIGIPMIVFGLNGLLAVELFRVAGWPFFAKAADGWPIEIALLLILAFLPVQLRLDARLGAVMFVLSVAFYLAARMLWWPVNLGLFVVGWVFQFIGHAHYEKKAPSFMTNLIHLLVGPLWVLNHFLHLRAEAPGGQPSAVSDQ